MKQNETALLLDEAIHWLERIRDGEAKMPGLFPQTGPYAAALLDEIATLRRDNEHAYNAFRELTEGRP